MDNNNPIILGKSSTPSEKTTLKLISTKTHVGPAKDRSNSRNKENWSAAAKKVMINNNLKVTTKGAGYQHSPQGDAKSARANSNNRSLAITPNGGGSVNAAAATAFFAAWDNIFGDRPGTDDYIARANKLNAIRNEVYEKLGINPTQKVRPELTEEQRIAYSEAVRPYSFDYFEVRLSFKQPGVKAVRSKTYRYLDAPDLENIKSRLVKEMKQINSKWEFTTDIVN